MWITVLCRTIYSPFQNEDAWNDGNQHKPKPMVPEIQSQFEYEDSFDMNAAAKRKSYFFLPHLESHGH